MEEEATTNYKKVATAIGKMTATGIKICTVDINKSQYMFEPDSKGNAILYGMKGLNGVGSSDIQQVIDNRPFASFADFKERTSVDKTATVSLIKAGAFDEFGSRPEIMREFLSATSNPKTRVTLQNFNALIERNLLPECLEFQKRLFRYNKALKANCAHGADFVIEGVYYNFFEKFFDVDELIVKGNSLALSQKSWKKMYDSGMAIAKDYLKEHQQEILDALNRSLLAEEWDKYATGNISRWEMDSLGCYCHPHELSCVNPIYYRVQEFKDLPPEPRIAGMFKNIPIRELTRIMGCVIAKDDVKSTVTLVTVGSGVVNVKMHRDDYANINRRISKVNLDGTKSVIENGWCQRGTLLIFSGYRRGDTFAAKKYRKCNYPLVENITKLNKNGTVVTVDRRADE